MPLDVGTDMQTSLMAWLRPRGCRGGRKRKRTVRDDHSFPCNFRDGEANASPKLLPESATPPSNSSHAAFESSHTAFEVKHTVIEVSRTIEVKMHLAFKVDTTNVDNIGLIVDDSDGKTLCIESIVAGGLLDTWNTQNQHRAIQRGDRIKSVNGVQGNAKALADEMRLKHVMFVSLLREGHTPIRQWYSWE